MKVREAIQRVSTPARERLAATRKRTLRSRSPASAGFTVMAARRVWSELRSRVIEPRKFDVRWSLPACVREGSTDSSKVSPSLYAWQATRVLVRSGSMSRAEKYWDSLGTCESQDVLPACGQRPQTSRRRGCGIGVLGSLSSLVLAFESRETQPMRSL
jgi:hypothetical protein